MERQGKNKVAPLFKHPATKTYGQVQVKLTAFLNFILDWGKSELHAQAALSAGTHWLGDRVDHR
jgi:hypothetical protein